MSSHIPDIFYPCIGDRFQLYGICIIEIVDSTYTEIGSIIRCNFKTGYLKDFIYLGNFSKDSNFETLYNLFNSK